MPIEKSIEEQRKEIQKQAEEIEKQTKLILELLYKEPDDEVHDEEKVITSKL